ncbi:LLM class flavin-dependent oxidoreductase [Amycolatopsis sp. PS_44_ISF1]|uniref:LLM class flavin-dependent oxidoreductase n=1 Tax=Amycolatopsis sp. PS_44_ISF1 TaxID=2974917 RepID=UPI0028DD475A|nr:LLM class flavin-dependent oxidoreductase [Amycolatopsis sp. PS_44_ISF1]MDT8913477.1 LLM class flavin-dependent oxidoreductase [Amycolatopsis sp. PS_44_ISF1]
MDIGIALPTMCRDYDRASTVDWCRLAEQGPFSSISCGERLTFRNQDMWITMSAAAALTERVRIFVNLSVLPAHPIALIAKQVATMDVLSGGRVTLGVGVGGREHDYRSLEASFSRRHDRLDEGVAGLRSLWAGQPPFPGADPIGPACLQPGGPPILAGALGPKAMARAAKWADGISSFSMAGDPEEMAASARAARHAWSAADREPPRLVSGCFYLLGEPEPGPRLSEFTAEYLAIFGPGIESFAQAMPTFTADAVNRALDGAEEAGLDEFILVPAGTSLGVLEATIELINARE